VLVRPLAGEGLLSLSLLFLSFSPSLSFLSLSLFSLVGEGRG
jgi:hypothetical protein